MRKAYQRKLNKLLSTVNKSIREDDLWKGRFEVRQMYSNWNEFSDGSGGSLFVILRWRDKKTKYYYDYTFDYGSYYWAPFVDHHIFIMANDFITQKVGVWQNDPERPTYKNAVDYTNAYISNEAFREGEYNFYLSFNSNQNTI